MSDEVLPDPRLFSPADRETAAWRAHEMEDMDLPPLAWFNSQPCPRHAPDSDSMCKDCGLTLRRHQRNGATWQFLAGKTLLADTVGSGKTATVLATLAMCKETGELSAASRCVIVCQAAAVRDPWAKDLARLVPGISVIVADGTPRERQRAYLSNWEVCVISDRTFAPARGTTTRDGDVELLREFPVTTLVYDDVDPMRNRDTKTAYAIRRLAASCSRVHGVHGTPLQKRLPELYSFTEPLGSASPDIFGTLPRFKQRYVSQDAVKLWVRAAICPGQRPCARHDVLIPDCAQCGIVHAWAPVTNKRPGTCPQCRQPGILDPTGRRRAQRTVYRDNGVQAERLPELQRLIAPLVLRRTTFDDVDLPDIQVSTVRLDLLPAQRQRYAELKSGVLKRLKNGIYEVSHAEAAAAFTRGSQICSGLAALDDGATRDISVKLDWVVDKLTGDLAEEKVVCYVHFRENVRALSARLDAEGIGHVLFWSEETAGQVRDIRRQRFLEDPDCRVLIGTTTIERSLNLQVAGHMVAVDTILNQSRMTQLVGRIRRQGSRFGMVTLHHLLARDTQEDGYTALLAREGAMADSVWGEDEAIFHLASPREIMEMIVGVPA